MQRRTLIRSLLLAPLLVSVRVGADTAPTGSRTLPKFSGASPGTLPAGWFHRTLPGVTQANSFALIEDGGRTVLQVKSNHSASSLETALRIDPAQTPVLHWSWHVAQPLPGSDLRTRQGDDYAARIYVLFAFPVDLLGFADRLKIEAARLIHGAELPAAALCYVWGNAQQAGDSGWSPYTDRLRMIVVESGSAHCGQWQTMSRNVAADFREAFGLSPPMISGIALGADTDNAGGSVETRFGDLWFDVS